MSDDVREMVERARGAFRIVEHWEQDRVDEMVQAVGWMWQKEEVAREITRLAVEESGMGVWEHKIPKQRNKTRGAIWDMRGVRTCGLVEEDRARGLRKYAKPMGVIANVTPCTNPTATPSFLGLCILKTRNAMVVSPHPRTRQATFLTIEYGRKALQKIGAPEDLFQCLREPTNEKTVELMSACDFVVATGGKALIRVVYAAGKPAHTVGAGNVVAIVDKSADLAAAADKIMRSKTFDNATSCSCENAVAIQESVFAPMLRELEAVGGYLCSAEEREKLRRAMWPDGQSLSREIPARSAAEIARLAGLSLPEGTGFLMVLGEKIGPEDPFCGEKLSVVLTVWKWSDFAEMVERLERILQFSGSGHSCAIHTAEQRQVEELALRAKVGRINVNMPNCLVNSGSWSNGQPFTTTLGCGTWAGNMTSDNINWRHFLNYTLVSAPLSEYAPGDEELFGEYLAKWGRG